MTEQEKSYSYLVKLKTEWRTAAHLTQLANSVENSAMSYFIREKIKHENEFGYVDVLVEGEKPIRIIEELTPEDT